MEKNEISNEDYWKKNFNNDKIVNASQDLQINVARTKNGQKVNGEIWQRTLSYIKETLKINKGSTVLELCCGNGVVIGELAAFCEKAHGIDYSHQLLSQLGNTYPFHNLSVELGNVNDSELKESFYDAIIIYFAIQHFNERDTFLLIKKCLLALTKKGKILVGDIPDVDRKWKYIREPEHQKDYFRRVVEYKPKIGNWFQKDFFRAMNSCFPRVRFEIKDQPDYQINSDHCFDVVIHKKWN